MDQHRFDAVIRLFAARQSRRTAIGALLGAAFLCSGDTIDAKPGRGKGRGKDRGRSHGKNRRKGNGKGNAREKVRAEAVPANCFTGSPCVPGPGKNLGKCSFGGSPALKNANLKGANLGSANLADADASGANLQGANLDKACLVDTNLTGAIITASTSIASAILCRATMPDGSTNNSGCNKGTRCCPTCDAENPCPAGQVCCNGRCRAGNCCVNGQATTCGSQQICDGGDCVACDVCPSGCVVDSVETAVALSPPEGTIRICAGTYPTNVSIVDGLTLIGAGAGVGGTILNGQGNGGVIIIGSPGPGLVNVEIRDLTITGGDAEIGGGIFNEGSLTLTRVSVTENEVSSSMSNLGIGGGIYNRDNSLLTLNDTSVTMNTASRVGGGIFNDDATVILGPGSVVANNSPDNCAGTPVPGCVG